MGQKQASENNKVSLTVALNETPLSLFHFKAMVTAGMGFFTDAYDLFIIGAVVALIKGPWNLSSVQIGLLGSSTLIATFLGAFIFGHIADKIGRKAVYGVEALIMAIGALASAFAPSFLWLLLCRFILGIGIGGDYPISGVIMSEYSNRKNRGKMVSLVFSMQALGLVIGPIIALTLLTSGIHPDLAWRIMLGLGALPALGIIHLRRTMPESPRFLAHVKGETNLATANLHEFSGGVINANTIAKSDTPKTTHSLLKFLKNKSNWTLILGTAGSWFLLDYAYYGNTISTPLILNMIAPGSAFLQTTAWSLIIFAVAALPGYVAAFSFIDQIGHRKLQWMGFFGMGVCFFALALVPGILTTIVPFLLVYGLSYFFTEFGPNVTTFVIPTEVFRVNGRTTGHGIAAGIGKLGAFLGVFIFPILSASFGLSGTLLVSAMCSFAGMGLTFILPEVAGKSLEEITSQQDEVRRQAVVFAKS